MKLLAMSPSGRSAIALIVVLGIVLMGASPVLAAPPDNDDPSSSTVITALPFTDTIDTTEATSQPEEPTRCNQGRGVWYAFTSPERVRVAIDTSGSDYSTLLAIFRGSQADDALVACQSGAPARLSFEAAAGQTYYVMVSGAGGVLTFNADVAKPPPNDDISAAATIRSPLPFRSTMDATEATLTLSDPSCFGKARTVWFRYTKRSRSESTKVVMKTFRSSYDTTLSVYSGQRGALTQLACNNDAASTRQSKVQFIAKPGRTYHVMVGSYQNSAAGTLVLTVNDAALPLKVSTRLDGTGSVSAASGRARIEGSVNCSRQARVRVSIVVRQKVGDVVVTGGEGKELRCRGRTEWGVWVASSRAFRPGEAGVWMTVSVPRQEKTYKRSGVVRLTRCSGCL